MQTSPEGQPKRARTPGLMPPGGMGLPERAIVVLMVGLFLFLCVMQLAAYWLSAPSSLVTRFADDAYFYFKIARNIVESGRVTFDGTTATNGFHPLWMGLLVPVFALAKDSLLVLRVAGTLNVVLLALACFLSFRYLARRYSVLTFGLSAVIVIRYFLAFTEYSMETSLLLPLCVLALVLVETIDCHSLSAVEWKRLLALGLTMALLQLARLDAVFLNLTVVASVFINTLVHGRVRQSAASLALLAAPSLIAGVGYLVVNRLGFGHFLPVSAQAKSMGVGLVNTRMLHQLIPTPSPGQVTSIWTVFSAMIIVSLACVLIFLAGRRRGWTGLVQGRRVGLIASVFCVAFVAYYLTGSSWRLWGWYSYPGFLVAVFALPEIVSSVEGRLSNALAGGRLLRLAKMAIVAALLVGTWVATPSTRWGAWRDADVAGNFMYQNYVLADSLNEKLSEPPKMAMGDRAGSFGYFYEGAVLQLEGLVGDYRLLDSIRTDSLTRYMSAFGVRYVICYNGPAAGYAAWKFRVPAPEFSAGPYADVPLCERDEVVRRETGAGRICVWKWPGCEMP